MGIDAMWRWGWCGLAALGAACAVADDGAWFDGQDLRQAWVQPDGSVALQAQGRARHLGGDLTVVTAPDQADAVAQALRDRGLNADTGLVPDRVYVRAEPEEVLATSLKLRGVAGVAQVRLQWATRVRVPQALR